MPELSDLPVETLRMIAERCDFRPRFNLRITSKLMKEVVDQSKFVISYVCLVIEKPRLLEMSFDYRNGDGNITRHKIRKEIENADSMEKAAKWMVNIFKNAEIEHVDIYISENKDLLKVFLQKVKETLKSPLKAQEIHWRPKSDPFLICDKSYVQRLFCFHDDPNFFQEYKEILTNLDEVWLTETMNITDQDVLSMKATLIFLKSENFSAEMINELVANFIAKGLIDLHVCLENPKGNFIPEIKIPDGFSNPTEIEGRHEKIAGNKKMAMHVCKQSLEFKIESCSDDANGDGV